MSRSVKKISVLGVSGSIGQSAMDVILSAPERFDVQCVSAHTNAKLLAKSARALGAKKAVIAQESAYSLLQEELEETGIEAACGVDAIEEAGAMPADIILCAIAGFAGLKPLMRAIEQGTSVAIANKEPLVAAGALVMSAAQKHGTTILPVDSEHNAIFQVFNAQRPEGIKRIILTASGGPFLSRTLQEMEDVTPEEAIAHPNWTMGKKISVDSATMMNKALEVIEAHYLFSMPADKIEVLIHPQSIIHSMVEYHDGSILSQMGASDMRTPIAHALAWPDRMDTPGKRLALDKISSLTFQTPDMKQFPAIAMAYKCLKLGPYACIAMNATNEVCVEAFLNNRIGFLDIMSHIDHIVNQAVELPLASIEEIIQFDADIRNKTHDLIESSLIKNNEQKAIHLS